MTPVSTPLVPTPVNVTDLDIQEHTARRVSIAWNPANLQNNADPINVSAALVSQEIRTRMVPQAVYTLTFQRISCLCTVHTNAIPTEGSFLE